MSQNKNNGNKNKLAVSGAKQVTESMKYEIAREFGVTLGPDSTSRANGAVGGEITKRLVEKGMSGHSKRASGNK